MEILALIILAGVFVWWGYKQLNREDQTGRHPLDSITPKEQAPYKVETPIVNNKTGDIVSPQITDSVTQSNPAWHTAPAAGSKLAENSLDINHDGKVDLKDVVEAVKKVRKPRTPKAEVAAKPAAKKAATKKAAAAKSKTKSKKS